MITIDRQDLQQVMREAREDWEFRHHGESCPFNATITMDVDVSELLTEIGAIRHFGRDA